jgi:poly(beta-D-mannuronate) lyase
MLRFTLILSAIIIAASSYAATIPVTNEAELIKANKEAKPGDIIVMQNGEWKDIIISLNCKGTALNPITVKAQTLGKVIITGKSKLRLGGEYIIVDGLYFTNGHAGNDAILKFRIDANQVSNHCRITNTAIHNFNNPKRLDENYWVALYGKNNQIDHCSFTDKKNMGVLMAVILDDERSRENFHSINNNYFGFRTPLASNTGEILRVGVSEHCEFNSNTQIVDNFFEHCDGETEIISIKSGSNLIRNNLFKECQGAVVLRHGNYNTVENNIFLGNGKKGTGGVRIINKGQWVVNNLFYKCRGVDFRSPLSVMNGVPNSPANRYVAVTDAVIANNSFFECTPFSLCEGSDAERSLAPSNVEFINNIFYNSTDSIIYKAFDDITKIKFSGNLVSNTIKQKLESGFILADLSTQKIGQVFIPTSIKNLFVKNSDSLNAESMKRLLTELPYKTGFSDADLLVSIENNAYVQCGAVWFDPKTLASNKKQINVNCRNAEELFQQISNNKDAILKVTLTGKNYHFSKPVFITTDLILSSGRKSKIKFSSDSKDDLFLLLVSAGSSLTIDNLKLDLAGIKSQHFITTDTSGSSNHSNIYITKSNFCNNPGNFFQAARTSVADSIIIDKNSFENNNGSLFSFMQETDKKGYYNVENLSITNNNINKQKGQILGMLRTGNDESTMGPSVIFANNNIRDCQTTNSDALIFLYGTQRSAIEKNNFSNCNTGKTLIKYEDIVRAAHLLSKNSIDQSGSIQENQYVEKK